MDTYLGLGQKPMLSIKGAMTIMASQLIRRRSPVCSSATPGFLSPLKARTKSVAREPCNPPLRVVRLLQNPKTGWSGI